jgi:hypothetical protein
MLGSLVAAAVIATAQQSKADELTSRGEWLKERPDLAQEMLILVNRERARQGLGGVQGSMISQEFRN